MAEPIVIVGSSRLVGNTARAAALAFPKQTLVHLTGLRIALYDYRHAYPHDDEFIELAERMSTARNIVLATPVYRYSMSAQMKIFLDRWSDLITVRKDIGRALAGRKLWLLATSPEPALSQGFEEPFKQTADYMDMTYGGSVHAPCPEDMRFAPEAESALRDFGRRVGATRAA